MTIDVFKQNRKAWDLLAEAGDEWTIPVSSEEIQRAHKGEDRGELIIRNSVPYSDLDNYSVEELQRRVASGRPYRVWSYS